MKIVKCEPGHGQGVGAPMGAHHCGHPEPYGLFRRDGGADGGALVVQQYQLDGMSVHPAGAVDVLHRQLDHGDKGFIVCSGNTGLGEDRGNTDMICPGSTGQGQEQPQPYHRYFHPPIPF